MRERERNPRRRGATFPNADGHAAGDELSYFVGGRHVGSHRGPNATRPKVEREERVRCGVDAASCPGSRVGLIDGWLRGRRGWRSRRGWWRWRRRRGRRADAVGGVRVLHDPLGRVGAVVDEPLTERRPLGKVFAPILATPLEAVLGHRRRRGWRRLWLRCRLGCADALSRRRVRVYPCVRVGAVVYEILAKLGPAGEVFAPLFGWVSPLKAVLTAATVAAGLGHYWP